MGIFTKAKTFFENGQEYILIAKRTKFDINYIDNEVIPLLEEMYDTPVYTDIVNEELICSIDNTPVNRKNYVRICGSLQCRIK